MTSGGQDWRGGRAPRNSGRQTESVPSWKQTRNPATGRSGNLLSRIRVVVAGLFLILLVALVIWFMRPARGIRTHIVLLNLLEGSDDFDGLPGLELSQAVQQPTHLRTVTVSRPETLALATGNAESDKALWRAQSVIVALQTLPIPTSDGDFKCMIRNSSPDLNDANQWVLLSSLKTQLTEFWKKNPAAAVLLLIDVPDEFLEWRTGYAGTSLDTLLDAWVQDFPKLTVVCHGDRDGSESAVAAGNGRTAFSRIAAQALTSLANSTEDTELSTSEFCSYVEKHTSEWVQRFRGITADSVRIFPNVEAIRGTPRDGKLFSEVAEGRGGDFAVGGSATGSFESIAALWSKREALAGRGAQVWNPSNWIRLTALLQKTERAMLSGLTERSADLQRDSERLISRLEQQADRIAPPSAWNDVRGISRGFFEGMPFASRIEALIPSGNSATKPATETPLLEDVVNAQIRNFAFAAAGAAAPSDELIAKIRSLRADGEQTCTELFRTAGRIPHTARELERQILRAEDLVFIRSSEDSLKAETVAEPCRELITALREFSESMDRTELTLAAQADRLSSFAAWAGHMPSAMPDGDRDIWISVLRKTAAGPKLGRESLSELLDPLRRVQRTSESVVAGFEKAAIELRAAIFAQFVYTKGLRDSFDFTEPETGYSASDLTRISQALNAWLADIERTQREISQLVTRLCQSATEERPSDHLEQLAVRETLRSALWLTSIDSATRRRILDALQDWEKRLAEAEQLPPATPQASVWRSPSVIEECLWMSQPLTLIPSSEKQIAARRSVQDAIDKLIAQPKADHQPLGEFGEAIRLFWRENSDNVAAAVATSSPDSLMFLRSADQQARWFSCFDAERSSTEGVTERFLTGLRFEFGRLQLDRVLAGQWVHPDDKAPWSQNAWYAGVASHWIRWLRENPGFAETAWPLTPSMSEHLSQAESQIQSSEQRQVAATAQDASLDLGEQSRDQGHVRVTAQMTNPDALSGLATTFVRIPKQSPLVVSNNLTAVSTAQAQTEIHLEFRRNGLPGGPDCAPATLPVESFFRGRTWISSAAFAVNTCAPAEYVTEIPARPANARIRLAGEELRPVVLILDLSKSMRENLSGTNTKKIEVALATMRQVINSPELRGLQVVLWVYGHRVDLVNGKNVPNTNYEMVFSRAIPSGLDANRDLEVLFEESLPRVDAQRQIERFEDVLDKLERSTAWGITPLFQTMISAMNVTLNRKPGIIIAVTDGDASDAYESNLRDLAKGIDANRGTSITVVAFDLAKNAQQRQTLQQTFSRFKNIRIEDATQGPQLLNKIMQSLDSRNYVVTSPQKMIREESELGTAVEQLAQAGDYSVQFDRITSAAPIALEDGDDVELSIDYALGRFRFPREKSVVYKTAAGNSNGTDSPDLIRLLPPVQLTDLAAPADQRRAAASLTLLLDHTRDQFPVRQPQEIELRIRPAVSDSQYRPQLVSQTFTAKHHSPGWDIRISEWPREYQFLVDAVWKMNRTSPEKVFSWTDLSAAISPQTARPLGGNGLPECSMWAIHRAGEVQIRLDPAPGANASLPLLALPEELERNDVDDIRVEIGHRDTLEQNSTFRPWLVATRIVRIENGSVSWQFTGQAITDTQLKDAEFSFTSAKARHADAMEVRDFRIAP